MKCAILIVAACVFAGAVATPVPKDHTYTSVNDIRQNVLEKITKLVDLHNDLIRRLEAADSESLTQTLRKEADRIGEELRVALEELLAISNGPSDGEELSTKERIQRRISEIRKAIVSMTGELASIIWQQARAHGDSLKERLAASRQKISQQLSDLKDELLVRLREIMIPDDDVPVNYVIDEVFEQIIASLKKQLSDAFAVMTDWHNALSESGRAKIAAAKQRVTELAKQIADKIRDWRQQKQIEEAENSTSTESSNYGVDPFYDDQFMLQLQDVLEEFKQQLEFEKEALAQSANGAEQGLLTHVEEVLSEVEASVENVREMIEGAEGTDASVLNTIANLRNLLARKVRELVEYLQKNVVDSQKIQAMEKEIASIRRRIIEAFQDVFKKP